MKHVSTAIRRGLRELRTKLMNREAQRAVGHERDSGAQKERLHGVCDNLHATGFLEETLRGE